MVPVAVVKVAVKGLFLCQALRRIGADRGADITEDGRGLVPGIGGAGLDLGPGAGGELRGHPVEEGAVVLGAGQGTSSGPSRP